jgi:peptidoglycan/xylan/chitin deacetylase (PgdA/CDA1 family)
MANRLLVLGWHNVEGTPCFPALPGHGRRGLERQLTALARLANVVPLAAALTDLHAGRPLPRRAVAITFDDGYADVLSDAVPVLARLGLPATFFLVPSFLSREVTAWWEDLAVAFQTTTVTTFEFRGEILAVDNEARRRAAFERCSEDLKTVDEATRWAEVADITAALRAGARRHAPDLFLDWTGARELARRGFDIGSHTSSHAILARESSTAQRADLVGARQLLRSRLSAEVSILAYPNGRAEDFDDVTVAAAVDAGHEFAISTIEGFHSAAVSPHAVRRCVVYPERGVRELLAALRYFARR